MHFSIADCCYYLPVYALLITTQQKSGIREERAAESSADPNINVSVELHVGQNQQKIRYFQYAHFIPIVGVGKRGAYQLIHGDLPRQHPSGTTLMFTGSMSADSRQ